MPGSSGRRASGRTAAGRPVREHHRADQVAARHGSPDAGVARVDPVVAEHEVVARRNAWPPVGFVTSKRRIDVGLDETVAIDVDGPVALRDELARKPDDALDEGRTTVTEPTSLGCLGSFEDDDLSPLRVTEPVRKPVGDHAVAESALAELGRLRAVKRWLHRRRGDAVRLGDLRFERQDEGNRDCDRDEPVDDRPPRLRYPALRTVENSHVSIHIVRIVSVGLLSRDWPDRPQVGRSRVARRSDSGSDARIFASVRTHRLH